MADFLATHEEEQQVTSTLTQSSLTAIQRAYEHQECAFCYESLTSSTISYLYDDQDQLVCYHSFHTACLEASQRSVTTATAENTAPKHSPCLHCQKLYCKFIPSPQVETDPREWFELIDTDRDGLLSYTELIEGLKSQLNLDYHKIEADTDRLFGQWDKDGNGVISYDEFIDHQNGVMAYLKHHFPAGPRPEPPNLLEDHLEDWFAYWDEDHSNSLDKSEITRALIKTFKIYNMDRSVVAQIVDKVWEIFDEDQSGVIELEEFTRRENLGEALVAQVMLETRGPEVFREVEEEPVIAAYDDEE